MKRTLYIFLAIIIITSCQLPAAKQPATKDSATAPLKTANDSFAASIQAKGSG